MLICFPDPYPDELFYSICARYGERMHYPSAEAINRDLFNNSRVVQTIALPCHLATLVENLPSASHYSVDHFIDRHTLLPLFVPFLPQKYMIQIREDMKGENGVLAYCRTGMLGVTGVSAPKVEHLRFCHHCINEDRKRWGECYWHRTHQAPGVQICPVHKAVLHTIDTDALKIHSRSDFLTAENIADQPALTRALSVDKYQSLLLDIALDVAWIIDQHNLFCTPAFFRERYATLLSERGLDTSYTHNRFNTTPLLQEFQTYYPAHLLQMLSCELAEHEMKNWLCRLLYYKDHGIHPLHHLLLIRFLGHSIETFINLPKPCGPFGNGPWPCLNRASEHYREKVIYDCSVSFSQAPNKRPKGVFSCECGFVYSRLGPDLCEDDCFKMRETLAVGPRWEETLRKLWMNPALSLRTLARHLGLKKQALLYHAARLGLSSSDNGGRLLRPTKKPQVHLNRDLVSIEKREHYRRLWLTAIEENPGAGVVTLVAKYPKVNRWLYAHDRSWRKEHTPQLKQQSKPRIDWDERDKRTVEKVVAAALQIRSSEGPPEQVTKEAIFRHIEKGMSLRPAVVEGKLPLTKQVLDTIVESYEEFIIRRIWWAKDAYLREKQALPTRREFELLSGFHHYYHNSIKVKEAFDLAFQSLKDYFSC